MGILFDQAWAESIRQTTNAKFSMEQGSATLVGYIDTEVAPEVWFYGDLITEVLGYSEPDGVGGLIRSLPLAHPQYPWLFASDLAITGLGFYDRASSSSQIFEAPPIDSFAIYKKYQYQITFTQRPYVLLQDTSIPSEALEYYDFDGNQQFEGNVPREYWRFTDFEELPSAEFLTAQQGQFTFDRQDGEIPDGNTVPGQLRLLQRKSTVKFRWYQVPNHYLTSDYSYIKAAQGTINQLEWNGWAPGTLLLAGCTTIKRYTPPNPDPDPWMDGAIGNAKLVDLEFTFQRFDPGLEPGTEPVTPANPNHIVGGHNLLPWMAAGGGQYYYARGGDNVNNAPMYNSYPFQLMFKDPEA